MSTIRGLAAFAFARAILYTVMLGLPIVAVEVFGPMILGGRP